MVISIKNLLILSVFSFATFFISNYVLDGSLNTAHNLGSELKSPPDSLYQWRIGEEAPFKYRVLHRVIVMGTYYLLSSGQNDNALFIAIYRAYAFLFHVSAVFLFYFFLLKIKPENAALAGAILFSLLPAFSLAYNLPVHTREDMIAYSLLILGLYSIINNHLFLLFVFVLLGVACRETLLLIPFVNLFFNSKQKLFWRFSIAAFAFVIFFMIRFFYGISEYDYLEGFRWNLHHFEQVVGFSYITFGVLWIPFFITLLKRENHAGPVGLIYRSSTMVFILIIITTFIGGIFNEIRLLYLLAPWVILIGIDYYSLHQEQVRTYFKSKTYLSVIGLLFLVLVVLTSYVIKNISSYIPPSQYAISYESWIIVSMIQIYLGLIFIPVFAGIKINKRTS